MRKKNACILGEIINCLSKKNKKNFEKKEKKWLTIGERSGIIFNVAANNGRHNNDNLETIMRNFTQ